MATFQTVNAGGPNQGAQNQVTCLESPNQSPILSTQKFQGQEIETSKRRPSIDNQSDQRSNSCPSRSGSEPNPEVDDILAQCSNWNFPIFELKEKTPEVLSKIAYRIFDLSELFSHFRLPRGKFLSYFRALENGYRSCAYHNSVHAADVLQSVWYLINLQSPSSKSPLSKRLLPEEVLSLLLAAAIHDFDHPGYTNNFLVTTGHKLAILYNDRSVLENHHVASAWKLMLSDPKNEFLSGPIITPKLLNQIRMATIKLVLSTDLAKHAKIIDKWKKLSKNSLNFDDPENRTLTMQMIIKCSDISNPAKEYQAHSRWSELVIKEFYSQGDLERQRGLPISKFMDREDPDIVGLQTSFIRSMVKPCFEALSQSNIILGVDSIVRRQLEQNLAIWEKTTVDQNGKLHLPDVDELIRKVHLRLAQEAQQRTVESQLLLDENQPQREIEEGSWQDDLSPPNGLIRACCAPFLSIFSRSGGRRGPRTYQHR